MKSSFNQRTVIGCIVPGFVFIVALAVAAFTPRTNGIIQQIPVPDWLKQSSTLTSVAFIVAITLAAFFIGAFFDALRNILEECFDRHSKDADHTWWDFFFNAEREKVEQLDDYYYNYYQLDANLVIACIILAPFLFLFLFFSLWSLVPLVAGIVFFLDAKSLRKEIKRLVQEYMQNQNEDFPHQNANARICCSVGKGVGVFAIRPLNKGTLIFPEDNCKIVWVPKKKLEKLNLSEEHKELYRDFAVFKKDKCGCPESFNNLTLSWYLNEPNEGSEPNTICNEDEGYSFYAARDIDKGEELTARYSDYSLEPWI